MALAEELDIEFARNIGQHRLLKVITERLIQLRADGKNVVLLLDDAQTPCLTRAWKHCAC